MTTKILNQAQAEAVYSAMCALNNVGGLLSAKIRQPGNTLKWIHILEYLTGPVHIWTGNINGVHDGGMEQHDNQSAFATAYGLQQG